MPRSVLMKLKKPKQQRLFKIEKSDFGGILRNTRRGRQGARPLARTKSMHLVLRSSKAKGDWSFRRPQNQKRISQIMTKFAGKYGVRVLHFANVGNHLHAHIQLSSRHTYKAFIRAVTGAIAQAVTRASRVNPLKTNARGTKLQFWDYRPFTRIIQGFKDRLGIKNYIEINQFEGFGYTRARAEFTLGFLRLRGSS